jgi:hypothetical protein
VHHQSILLNNQRDAALSSCIYSSLQGYSACFGCFLYTSSGVQLKLQTTSTVLIVLLMMGAESTRNMYSNLAEKNKYDFLKLHHVG